MPDNMRKSYDFENSHIIAKRASSMISRKLLTSLKLFVKKKYLRSRRAPRASTKTPKVKNTQYMHVIGAMYVKIQSNHFYILLCVLVLVEADVF